MSPHGPTPVPGWTAPSGVRSDPAGTAMIAGAADGLPVDPVGPWPWRLHLQYLPSGSVHRAGPDRAEQVAALDAPLRRLRGESSPWLPRLQTVRLEASGALAADEATRLATLAVRDDTDATLIARPLQGTMLLPADARWLAWLLTGRAEVRREDRHWPLDPATPVWLPHDPAQRLRIDGGGELLLVRLAARPAQGV